MVPYASSIKLIDKKEAIFSPGGGVHNTGKKLFEKRGKVLLAGRRCAWYGNICKKRTRALRRKCASYGKKLDGKKAEVLT
jgi:hypothetical protein